MDTPADLDEKANPHMNWETVNPEWWCPREYACLRIDSRGSGQSPGKCEPSSYQESSLSYSASGSTAAGVASGSSLSTTHGGAGRLGVSFESDPMPADSEITGPLMLNLWVSSSSEDMDIMCTLRNIGADGKDVWEVGQHGGPVPLTKGWLRASHRKTDALKSTPYRPFHPHDERQWLEPNQPVECPIEIWPTCIVLKKGHKLRFDIQPRDGVGAAPYTHYHCDYNAGATNTIYAGGDKQTYLLVPFIPAK